MKNCIILFLICSIVGINAAFSCLNSTGVYGNPNNYRSFYVCNNYCPSLEYCKAPNPYFSNDTQRCISEPNNWIPRYYLSGTAIVSQASTDKIYIQQNGYQLIWTFDDATTSETFTGHYINETHVHGIHVRRLLLTNCICVFDVKIVATADRNYCATHSLHPQSAICDFSYPYEFTYCRTVSF